MEINIGKLQAVRVEMRKYFFIIITLVITAIIALVVSHAKETQRLKPVNTEPIIV